VRVEQGRRVSGEVRGDSWTSRGPVSLHRRTRPGVVQGHDPGKTLRDARRMAGVTIEDSSHPTVSPAYSLRNRHSSVSIFFSPLKGEEVRKDVSEAPRCGRSPTLTAQRCPVLAALPPLLRATLRARLAFPRGKVYCKSRPRSRAAPREIEGGRNPKFRHRRPTEPPSRLQTEPRWRLTKTRTSSAAAERIVAAPRGRRGPRWDRPRRL